MVMVARSVVLCFVQCSALIKGASARAVCVQCASGSVCVVGCVVFSSGFFRTLCVVTKFIC